MSSHLPFSVGRRNKFSKKRTLSEGIGNFNLPGSDDKNVGESFAYEGYRTRIYQ